MVETKMGLIKQNDRAKFIEGSVQEALNYCLDFKITRNYFFLTFFFITDHYIM